MTRETNKSKCKGEKKKMLIERKKARKLGTKKFNQPTEYGKRRNKQKNGIPRNFRENGKKERTHHFWQNGQQMSDGSNRVFVPGGISPCTDAKCCISIFSD